MNPAFSLYLDALRAVAALTVVMFHFTKPEFTEGRYQSFYDLNLGPDAVIVFFVISGFVIAYCAKTKDRTLSAFAFARSTRLISVILPALIAGFILDRIGASTFPDFYQSIWYNPVSLVEQFFRGLTLSNEWQWDPIRLGTNGPLWSMSYEAAYYLLFAIAFFLRGWIRILLIFSICCLIGPNILLLLPCWCMGVWLYHQIERETIKRRSIALILLPLFCYVAALTFGLPEKLLIMTAHFLSVEAFAHLRFSASFAWHSAIALLVTAHLFAVSRLCDDIKIRNGPVAGLVRFFARSSFSIYVLHYPVMYLAIPNLAYVHPWLAKDVAVLAVTLTTCLIFAAVFERSIAWQRRVLRHLAGAKETSAQPPSS